MILLEFAVVGGKPEADVSSVHVRVKVKNIRPVMEKVMSEIITYVPEYSAAVDCHRCVPVVEKYCVCKLPERGCNYNKQSRWHDKPQFVHREVMVNAVEEEMSGYTNAVIREIPVFGLAVS